MISINDKKDCCGCSACVQICPKHCIEFIPDKEGFIYPSINVNRCIDCHLCESVCPVLNQNSPRKPLKVVAAFNKSEEVRMRSSSGGVFHHIATKILNEGGVVFGSRFDERWNVIHDFAEESKGLMRFQGSKYVQSEIGTNFIKVRSFLQEGRKVLFTGTPCQIRGLKLFLRKDYSNLYTADFVCHGVPSPRAWIKYLKEVMKDKPERSSADGENTVLSLSLNAASAIADVAFRDKNDYGWGKFCFVVRKKSGNKARQNSVLLSDIHYKNPYFYLFLCHLMERKSCYDCPVKCGKSDSDITMGDYWNVNEDEIIKKDGKGISLVLVNSNKGADLIDGLMYSLREYTHALVCNPMIAKSLTPSLHRDSFYTRLDEHSFETLYKYFKLRNQIIDTVNKCFKKLRLKKQLSK